MKALRWIAFSCAFCLLSAPAQRKKKSDVTQILELPKELPSAVSGDTRRLIFRITPLSAKGLLSQQIRDALKAITREGGEERVLQMRAFVAGSGDVRRVRDLVSEVFTDRKQPLPALSLVQSGGLPLEGAQVVFEYTGEVRREVDPYGLAFLSAQSASAADPQSPMAPLVAQSLAALGRALKTADASPADVLRVTCFLSSLDNLAASRQALAAAYPAAVADFIQTERAPSSALAACEAVARLTHDAGAGLRLLNADAQPADAGQSQIALIGSPHVVLTGTQASFGYEEKDARLAFERLQHILEQSGSSLRNAAFLHYYPLSPGIAAQVRKIRTEFFTAPNPPAGSMLQFESLPSMDAGFAMDAIAVKN
jgi:enamine deaminase RidA (YjgF/YER057c/UK114 family)